jgi:hypothetical protein
MSEANKAVVHRLVEEVLNGGRLEVIDELYAPPPGRPSSARTTDASCVDATFSAVCFTSTGELHERLYAPHTLASANIWSAQPLPVRFLVAGQLPGPAMAAGWRAPHGLRA